MSTRESQWNLYDSNVQSYRANSIASQSFLLAIGAILYDKNVYMLLLAFLVAMFQMWYVWYRVIRARALISDYHKFNAKYNFSSFINDKGEYEANTLNPLTEETYADYKTRRIRRKANACLAEKVGIPKLKHNYRITRIKLDLLLPISFTILWMAIVVSKIYQILD